MLLPFDPAIRLHLFGIRVSTRTSSLVIIAVVVGGVLARLDGGLRTESDRVVWLLAVLVTSVALLAALLAHERARLWAYRRSGASVRRSDLYLFGGSQEVIDDTVTPRSETFASLVGLAALVALAAVATGGSLATLGAADALHLPLKALAIALGAIALLQAMPALPLDGGRIFRAWLWYLTDDAKPATHAAAFYAQIIAAGGVAAGIILFALDGSLPFWGLGITVAALHLGAAARTSVHRSTWQRLSRAFALGDALPTLQPRLPTNASVDDAADELISADHDCPLAVVDPERGLLGVVAIGNLRRVRRIEWDRQPVTAIMTPISDLPVLAPDLSVFDAVAQLDDAGRRIALATTADGRTIVVSREQLLDRLFERQREAS